MRAVFSLASSFRVTGTSLDRCIATNTSEDFTVAFSPQNTGPVSSLLQIGFKAYPSASGCPADPPQSVDVMTLTALQGNATASSLTISFSTGGSATTVLRSGDSIGFGQVAVDSSQTVTVTVKNVTASPVNLPVPALVSTVFSHDPYSLGGISSVPAVLPPGGSTSFTITFAPNQPAYVTSLLTMGNRQYPLTGTGIAGPGLQSLVISYTLPSGVHYNVSAATPIDFGSATAGSSQTFIFTVVNPQLNALPVTIPTVALSGANYSLTNLPTLPAILQPGGSTTFSVVFSAAQAGTSAGTLSIGSLQFNLTGKAIAQTLNPQFQFTPASLTSQQQAQISIQFPDPPQANGIGTLALSFQSAVSQISDDPAILFVSTGGRNANATLTAGAPGATFTGNQSSLTFQTGTTAGTLTFTLSFADGTKYTKSADIVPTTVQISSATATRQNPNLVVDFSAFDNTYSATKIVFTFYDTKGNVLTPGGLTLDETQPFHQYFYGTTKAGGAFSLQATFPVTGDITQVGAVDVTVQNSSGVSAVKHLTFN